MRSLLLLLAVPASLAAYYAWRLEVVRFELDRLTGVILATAVVILWSAVLQIALREKDERPDSPAESPDSPALAVGSYRAILAGLCVVLAIPVTAFAWHWIGQNADRHVARFCVAANLPIEVRWTTVTNTPRSPISAGSAAEPEEFAISRCATTVKDPLFTPPTYPCLLGRAPQLGRPHSLIARHQPPRDKPTHLTHDDDDLYTVSVSDLVADDLPAAVTTAIQRGDADRLQELIEAGADVNSMSSENGLTPLEEAEMCGQQEVIDLLQASGAQSLPDA